MGINLTKRELEIAKLIAKGKSNSEIASKLNVASSTVTAHLINMYRKLNVHNRAHAVAKLLTVHGFKRCI